MPEHKHTPGPWRIVEGFMGRPEIESDNERDNADATQVFVLARDIGGRVHGELFDDYSEVEANIKLIAAAPDLLRALIEVTASLEWNAHGRCRGINDGPIMPSAMAVELARAAIAKATGQA